MLLCGNTAGFTTEVLLLFVTVPARLTCTASGQAGKQGSRISRSRWTRRDERLIGNSPERPQDVAAGRWNAMTHSWNVGRNGRLFCSADQSYHVSAFNVSCIITVVGGHFCFCFF